MSIIYVLIPIAIILVLAAVGIFFWAVRSEQFRDLDRHGHSILFDDDLDKQQPHNADKTSQSADINKEKYW